jgi:hypothetical protein
MKPLTPQSRARILWEERVYDVLIDAGMSRGDAQGLLEAHDQAADRSYAEGKTPVLFASELLGTPQ